MGTNMSIIDSYTPNDLVGEKIKTSGIDLYFKESKPDFVMIEKHYVYDPTLRVEDLPEIDRRAKVLSKNHFLPGKLGSYGRLGDKGVNVKFLLGSMDLNDYVTTCRFRGAINKLPEDDVRFLLNSLRQAGIELEQHNEYHPKLAMASVFLTHDGIKLQNPFSYSKYVVESKSVYLDPRLPMPQTSFTERNEKILQQKYAVKIRENVRHAGLIVLYSATLRHDTELGDHDDDAFFHAMADFSASYSPDLVETIKQMIREDQSSTEDRRFSALPHITGHKTAPALTKITNEMYVENFYAKLNGPDGFFNRNFNNRNSFMPGAGQSRLTTYRAFPDDRKQLTSAPKNTTEQSYYEQLIREERPNPYSQRQLSNSPARANESGAAAGPNGQNQPKPPVTTSGVELPPTQGTAFTGPGVALSQAAGVGSTTNWDPKDPIPGRVEQLFRERRLPADMNKSLQEMTITAQQNQMRNSVLNKTDVNASLYHHNYTGRFEKADPKMFKFPIMNVGQAYDNVLPPNINYPKNKTPQPGQPAGNLYGPTGYPGTNGSRGPVIPGNMVQTHIGYGQATPYRQQLRNKQVLLLQGHKSDPSSIVVFDPITNKTRPLGPAAFVPPIENLQKYSRIHVDRQAQFLKNNQERLRMISQYGHTPSQPYVPNQGNQVNQSYRPNMNNNSQFNGQYNGQNNNQTNWQPEIRNIPPPVVQPRRPPELAAGQDIQGVINPPVLTPSNQGGLGFVGTPFSYTPSPNSKTPQHPSAPFNTDLKNNPHISTPGTPDAGVWLGSQGWSPQPPPLVQGPIIPIDSQPVPQLPAVNNSQGNIPQVQNGTPIAGPQGNTGWIGQGQEAISHRAPPVVSPSLVPGTISPIPSSANQPPNVIGEQAFEIPLTLGQEQVPVIFTTPSQNSQGLEQGGWPNVNTNQPTTQRQEYYSPEDQFGLPNGFLDAQPMMNPEAFGQAINTNRPGRPLGSEKERRFLQFMQTVRNDALGENVHANTYDYYNPIRRLPTNYQHFPCQHIRVRQ